ncbi:ROK family transcriptional regulator [Paenibacillus dakarensis]|uniref:ROK family transcriptional regulator n=1 Tax=Paenibacillus dakarensis TaxID=1527293 RepID=UPI0006D5870D|nr:ROK family transcriptional regulator [Paenibacillus dakarensis]
MGDLVKQTSHMLLKSINQQKVLFLIYSEGPISRVELSEKTGLSRQTVTNIVNRLLKEKIILIGELIDLEGGSGRKRVGLHINSSHFYAVGLELAGKYIRGKVYNLRQEAIASAERTSNKYGSIDVFMQLLHEVIDELLTQVPNSKIKGIGISMQGLVDSQHGIVLRTPGIGFHRLPLKQLLEDKYNIPVFIENDINLLSVNENMYGRLKDSNNNITINFDYGTGGAIVHNKQIIAGSSFVAGEFGHYKGFYGEDAYPCHCGRTGCLTTLASSSGLSASIKCTLEEFAEGIRTGDPKFLSLYEKIVDGIAIAVTNIITFINPDSLLITGRVIHTISPEMFNEIKARVMHELPVTVNNVQLIYLHDNPDETKLAAGLVIKHAFEVPLDTLSL